jgi:zinc protease
MGFLLGNLDNTRLANQRDVVRNERRETTENEPYGLADEALFHVLFPKGHPYYAHVIGSHADLEAVRLNEVHEFFRLYYAPNNASLAIVGDIDKRATRRLVEKYFGSLPAGKPVPAIEVTTPPITTERRAVIPDQIELPRVYMAWITSPIYTPGDADEQLLGQILGIGKSSRLYRRLIQEGQLAQDVYAEQYSLALGSIFFIQVTARAGVKPEQLEEAITEEVEALRRNGPTQAELDGARNVFEANIVRNLEKLGGVANRLNQYNHFVRNPYFLPKDIERYEQATVGSLKTIAQKQLAKNSRVVIYAVPGKKVIDDVPRAKTAEDEPAATLNSGEQAQERAEAWRSQPPGPGPASAISLPSPRSLTLSNGLTVLLLERHSLPVVAANLIVRSGAGDNPPGKPGLAALTAAMLMEGTRKRTALQMTGDAERIGAEIETRSTSDWSGALIRCLKQNIDPAFTLLSELTLTPAFGRDELERLRRERLGSIAQDRNNSRSLAQRTFYRLLYGESHPYGFLDIGTEDSVKNTQVEDIRTFWKDHYQPANAALVIAGDLTETEARSLGEKYFGRWKGESRTVPPPAFTGKLSRQLVIIDKPGAPQSSLLAGTLGAARSTPDYVPLEVLNTMMGGLFSSRINMNLRERNGYTYGATSRFLYRLGQGPFLARTDVRTEVTAAALKELLKELDGIRSHPLTADELKTGKDAMNRSLPGLFETTLQAAKSASDLFVYSLPLAYYSSLPAQIESVDSASVKQVAEKYIHPESMILVVVGDRARIEPEIKKLELGLVEHRDREGRPEAEHQDR